ncbi:MAG: DUF1684 domain-containing protein [Candidatus Limnocylindria bacterium]
MTPAGHRAGVEAWWAARDRRLRDPDGWLTLVGLHWLAAGDNRFGADASNEVVLAGDGVPALAGRLRVEDGVARLLEPGQPPRELAPDTSGEPTMIDVGSLRMYVIQRGGRLGLRVRDHASPALAAFDGMDHFPFDPSWRLLGRLQRAEPGATLEIMDVTGIVSRQETPGRVAFERDGGTWHLDALPGDEGELWLIFADETNGAETYGGGRFVYSEAVAADGSVWIDFNVAYNPPCVFTPFATCPLPPPQNRLALRISAGERAWHP